VDKVRRLIRLGLRRCESEGCDGPLPLRLRKRLDEVLFKFAWIPTARSVMIPRPWEGLEHGDGGTSAGGTSVVDSDRLRALAQEAQGCFDEMAEIASRARGMPFDRNNARKIFRADATHRNPVLIEILDLPDGTTCCAVWQHIPGPATLECPCGG